MLYYTIMAYHYINRYSCFVLGNQPVIKRNLYLELDNMLKTLKKLQFIDVFVYLFIYLFIFFMTWTF